MHVVESEEVMLVLDRACIAAPDCAMSNAMMPASLWVS
jgi:hypothetical protein